MTRDIDSADSGATVVVIRDSATAASRRRTRAGALRGGSPYLGTKAQDLKVLAKRLGRPVEGQSPAVPLSQASKDHETATVVSSISSAPSVIEPDDAPRLYHGLPSGAGQDDISIESTRVIDSLESELTALAGRMQRRTAGTAPTSAERPSSPQAEPVLEAYGEIASQVPNRQQPATFCESRGRWDDFGRDSRSLEQFNGIARFLTQRYFRTKVTGIEHIPASGPCLLVANHSGALPIDGLVLKSAIWAAHPAQRHIRWLTEDFVQNLPFIGTYLQRLGAVRASRENVLRLLQNGECVVAFPEGFKGYAKPIAQWYRVQRLGRGRIVGLCLQAGVPLLPCAIVGAEEATPSIRRLEAVERWLGTPYFPITPTFPWLGPLGLVPAPTRWHIDIGPSFLSGHEPARVDDPLYIADLTAKLRTTLQQRLDRLVAQRKSTWFG